MESGTRQVRQFRQILLWPLQLVPAHDGVHVQRHWDLLIRSEGNLWTEVADEFTGDPAQFQERHYSEFVAFLPYVQRFLYGESLGAAAKADYGESPIKVFRRHDVARLAITYTDGEEPALFDVAHTDVYFFYDLDIAILVLEIFAENLSLALAQDTLYRFGRAFPAYWDKTGAAAHCPSRVEWLSPAGEVLAASDYERREKYLSFVCRYRAPCIASHWEYLLAPMVLDHSQRKGLIRYRQIEHYRMPLMAYLAMEDPGRLTRADFVRLALAAPPGEPDALPYSARHVAGFEERYCYDRHWEPGNPLALNTRFLCSGHAFVMVGDGREPLFTDRETGLLGQFRHKYFLVGLIAHFHKAALLLLSERTIVAISRLDIRSPDSIRHFKRHIRQTLEIFLRFSYRYWFHEVSDQIPVRDLFRMWSEHLATDRLFAETREEVQDMSQYLEWDGLRRQANTVVRLTVVTTFGLIGTVATGFLGMNLIAEADQPLPAKIFYFLLVFIPVVALTFYTIVKSKRLSDFLDVLSDERVPTRIKFAALLAVWKRRPRAVAD